MSQLRWILLGAGIALILGLWWWEARKARAKAAANGDEAWPRERAEPTVEPGSDGDAASPLPEPSTYPPTNDRIRVARRPPMIEIPDDLEVDVSAYVGKDRRRAGEAGPAAAPEAVVDEDVAVAAHGDAEPLLGPEEVEDDHHRAPWIRTQPLERSEVTPKPEAEPPEPAPADQEERPPRQRPAQVPDQVARR